MTRPVKQSGFIYFLLAEGTDAVKIGYTHDFEMKSRMQQYHCHSPYNFDLLKILPGTMIEERNIHKRFVKLKIRGEWFKYTEELKEFIENL